MSDSDRLRSMLDELREVVRGAFSGESVSMLVEGHAIMRAIDEVEAATLGDERIAALEANWNAAKCSANSWRERCIEFESRCYELESLLKDMYSQLRELGVM